MEAHEQIKNLWSSSKFWRNIVLGAVAVKVSSKVIGHVLEHVVVKMLTVQVPNFTQEKDVVYLHSMPRNIAKSVPSGSPFAVKLELWLRANKIKYELIETTVMSKQTSKIPYVVFNGEEYTDSDLIINFLSEYFAIDEKEGLSLEEWAIARSMRKMLDEEIAWTVLIPRYVYNPGEFGKVFQHPPNGPKFLTSMFKESLKDSMIVKAYGQGLGRLSAEQVAEIGKDDLRAVSRFLGNKQYLMGDRLTKVDCSVFGQLSQIVYVDFPFRHKEILASECTNIMPYMERIKEKYWPDWDKIVPTGYFS